MAQLPADVLLVARWVGVALLAIGVASGMARNDRGGAAMRGVLVAILVYNVGAVALFVYAAVGLRLPGLLLWPAVALHTVLAVWGVLSLNAATAQGRPRLIADSGRRGSGRRGGGARRRAGSGSRGILT